MNEIIAIDGPAGAGKSTVSRLIAARLRYSYLDTGAMYRAVALVAKRQGLDFKDGQALMKMCRGLDLGFDRDADPPKLMLGSEDISALIRSPELDMLSSSVSVVREVREAMTDLQRRMAQGGKVVAEGRDMGTVVFPMARWKFYLTASTAARVERRYRERLARGEVVTQTGVAEDLRRRDLQDRGRALSPLKPAEDAIVIDSTASTAEEVVGQMLRHIQERSDAPGTSESFS